MRCSGRTGRARRIHQGIRNKITAGRVGVTDLNANRRGGGGDVIDVSGNGRDAVAAVRNARTIPAIGIRCAGDRTTDIAAVNLELHIGNTGVVTSRSRQSDAAAVGGAGGSTRHRCGDADGRRSAGSQRKVAGLESADRLNQVINRDCQRAGGSGEIN